MILDKLSQIKKLITELDAEIGEYVRSSPDINEACSLLAEANFVKQDFSFIYDTFSSGMVGVLATTDFVTLADGVEIEKKSGYDRKKWNHKDLGSAVVDKLVKMSIDMDTGEVTKSPRDVAMEILNYCAPSYWRVKELDKIGINADNYCEVGDMKTNIIVRRPKN